MKQKQQRRKSSRAKQKSSISYKLIGFSGFVSLIFFLVGWISLKGSALLDQDAKELAHMPVLSATLLGDSRPGKMGFIEGRISERNPAPAAHMAVYYREDYQGESCTEDDDGGRTCESIWIEKERVTPPIWLDLPDGPVHVVNSNYQFTGETINGWSGLKRQIGDSRYYGLKLGNPAFALGSVVMEGKEQAFQATFVNAGNVDSFILSKRRHSFVNFWGGFLFLCLGVSKAIRTYKLYRKLG